MYVFVYLFIQSLVSVWTHVYSFNNLSYKSNTVICLVAQVVLALAPGGSFRLALVSLWHAPIFLFLSTSLLAGSTRCFLLILCFPAPTPESTISQKAMLPFRLSVCLFVFPMLTTISAVNNDSFAFPFQSLCLYFSCPTEMARISSTVLNRKYGSGRLLLLAIVQGTPLTFPY